MLFNGDVRYFDYVKMYRDEKIKWKKKYKFDSVNFHFLREQLFTGSLGNYASCYEYLESQKYNLNNKKNLIFIKSTNNKITNNALFDYFKDFIFYIDNRDIYNKLKFSTELPLDLPLGHSFEISDFETFPDLGYNLILQEKHKKNLKNEMLFKLKKEHIEYGYNQLKTLGITEEDWWVTVHCRSGTSKNDTSTEFWRNSDINKFMKAIDFINSEGGYVFRMGDKKMPNINQNKMLIDYANSDIKNDIMDVFLGAKSKFHLGTSSGYPIIPRFFGVPLLLCETTQTLPYWSLNDFDVFLPRLYKSTITKELINFRDSFKPPYSIMWFDVKSKLKDLNLEIIENDSEDILEAAQLLNKICNNNFINIDTNLQKKFKNNISQINETYNIPKLVPFGNVPHNFLKKYEKMIIA